MTLRASICVGLAVAFCVVGAACSDEVADPVLDTSAPPSDDASRPAAEAGSLTAHQLSALGTERGCCRGRNCPPERVDCGQPPTLSHGTVQAPWIRYGGIATYACSAGYNLVGAASRLCQINGTWSRTAPTCSFAGAGSSCGSCGGTYDVNGTCSVGTPPDFGLPCGLGSGQGACANGGIVSCGGICQPAAPTIGDATKWHIVPAPNGSWDWDCDGAITITLVPTQAPPECLAYADSQSCNEAPTIEYVTEASSCGAQATLFKRDCDWKTLGPTCLDTPAGHRVVFQQCR